MIIMVAIGVGVFVGFNIEWYTLEKSIGDFMSSTDYADFRLYDENGFSENEISAIKEIDGVAEATRILNVNVDVKNENKSLSLCVIENYTVSTMLIEEGIDYDETSDGFWLSEKYAEANGVALGDVLTLTYRNVEISGEIVGLVRSSEFLVCVSDDNQLMPDYSSFGFVYAAPDKIFGELHMVYYPQVNLLSSLEKSEMESEVKQALHKTVLLLSKEEHTSYAAAQSEIEEGQTMVSVLPVLFLLIGILTMITTMHRIAVNEKTQIGTLKALGFKNKKITGHYTSYGLFVGMVGAILGIFLGYGIGALILNPNGTMGTYFDLPVWKLYMPWWTWLAVIGAVAFLTVVSFLSVKKMLKGNVVDTLRPYTPKKVKPLAVERTKRWNKLPFSVKWNLRDMFRHKTRTFMTFFGIVCCMLLLVGGLGMQDTMTGYLDTIDTKSLNYTTRINLTETADNEQTKAFAEKYDGDYLASSSVQVNGDAVALEIYNVAHDTVLFNDKDNHTIPLADDGAYICIRLANKGIKVGDFVTVSPYGSEDSYVIKVAGVIRSFQTENISMTCAYADSVGIPYHISSVFVNVSPDVIELDDFISGMQTKEMIMESYHSFTEMMNIMVLLLVLAAIILGIVVLYNLGVMSYMERYRELATLKVVGFKNRHIGRILISQNVWITLVGILIGLPAGVGILQLLIDLLAAEYELKMTLGALTYLVSVIVTFGTSLVVSFFVSRKNRKIDMVEALKGIE